MTHPKYLINVLAPSGLNVDQALIHVTSLRRFRYVGILSGLMSRNHYNAIVIKTLLYTHGKVIRNQSILLTLQECSY